MEMNVGGGRRRLMSREASPDRARGVMGLSNANIAAAAERQGIMRMSRGTGSCGPSLVTARRLQIVYYLCRNGQLEHPHFMELPHLPNHHHLRLIDVMERLTVLRGKGMPSLYSWSCKRSYKNGYVWNDLSENDVIYPADGAEYVLKGSEIIPGSSCSDRFQQQLRLRPPKLLPTRLQIEPEPEYEEEAEEEEEGGTVGGNHTASDGTRCSRGVSTDEAHAAKKKPAGPPKPGGGAYQHTEIAVDDGSPPSSSSSDPAAEPAGLGRNSVFFNLISCGSGAGVKGRKSGGNPHKGVVLGRAAMASRVEDEEEVRFTSENPRFGYLQGEDKEYFSGSIVLEGARSAAGGDQQPPGLKKSSSYNEERSSKVGIGEECLVGGGDRSEGGVKGKCIPGRKKYYFKK